MEHIPCTFIEMQECSVFRREGMCREDKHHLFYPRADYAPGVESRFRNLGENVVKICRNLHNLEHHVFEPPEKPDLEIMQMAVEESRNRRNIQ